MAGASINKTVLRKLLNSPPDYKIHHHGGGFGHIYKQNINTYDEPGITFVTLISDVSRLIEDCLLGLFVDYSVGNLVKLSNLLDRYIGSNSMWKKRV